MTLKTQLAEALVALRDLLGVLDSTVAIMEENCPSLAEVGYWSQQDSAVVRRARALASVAPKE